VATTDEYRWQNLRERLGVPLEPAVTERCAYCTFEIAASFEQAREAFAAHECDRPQPTSTKRRTSGFSLRHTP
jgi:hypothetical protein